MGNGVPNDGPFRHYMDDTLVGIFLLYHDQLVTDNAWHQSPEMVLTGYAALYAEAEVSEQAFLTKLATTAWDAWLTAHPGVSRAALRQKVLDLPPL